MKGHRGRDPAPLRERERRETAEPIVCVHRVERAVRSKLGGKLRHEPGQEVLAELGIPHREGGQPDASIELTRSGREIRGRTSKGCHLVTRTYEGAGGGTHDNVHAASIAAPRDRGG